MIKIDDMGTYEDTAIPLGLSLPLKIDQANESVANEDGTILARYGGGTIESSVLILERRKAEFVVKLANGELLLIKDKKGESHVFKPVQKSLKNGRVVIEYEEIKELVSA